jgi:hypothetical protein
MARALKGKDPSEAKPSRPKILIFGKSGVGKTWASIDFPNVYYIDTEGGANLAHYTAKLKAANGSYLGPDEGANDFTVVLDEIQTLATTSHPYKTLVIDSYSKLFGSQIAATAEAMENAKKKNEFGADKKPAVAYTRRMIRWLDMLDMNVILICHEKPVWKDGEQTGVTYDGWDKLEYELHLALRITKTGNSRNAIVTKSRLQGFADAATFPWSYGEFAARYGRDVIEATANPVKMATPTQLAQYQALMQSFKVDPKVLEKWEENCADVNDLDFEGMAKRISYLASLAPKSAA